MNSVWRPATKTVAILLCVAMFEIVLLFVTKDQQLMTSPTYIYETPSETAQENTLVAITNREMIEADDLQSIDRRISSASNTPVISTRNLSICTMAQRVARVKEICQELGHQVPKEFRGVKKELALVDRNHRIVLGWVSKGGCTALKSLLLDAAGFNVSRKFHSHNLIGVHSTSVLRKHNIFRLHLIKKSERPHFLNNYTRILVVRNPFERLLSTYRGKVVGRDFITGSLRKRIWAFSKSKAFSSVDNSSKLVKKLRAPSFSQFVQWIAHSKNKNVHWNPIFAAASACSIQWDYVLRLETMQHDSQYLMNILRKDLPYDKMPVRHSHKKGPTFDHSSMLLPEYKNVPQSAIDYFIKLYRVDMKMFGYQFDQSTTTATCSIKQESDTSLGCC